MLEANKGGVYSPQQTPSSIPIYLPLQSAEVSTLTSALILDQTHRRRSCGHGTTRTAVAAEQFA